MNIETLDELEQAEREHKESERRVNRLAEEAKTLRASIQNKLSVGRNVPVKAAILENGKIAVNVWTETENTGRASLHILEPTDLKQA